MKRLLALALLLAVLPGCGLWDKLFGESGPDKSIPVTPPPPPPVTPVMPDQLVTVLPKLDGWEMPAPVGEMIDVGPNKASRATGTYKRQSGEMALSATLRIVDGANSADIYGPLARMAHTRPDEPHKMPIELQGNTGIQEWLPEENKVNVALVVSKRFLVTLEGQYITPAVVQQLLQGIDVKKLAEWAAVQPPTARK